MFLDAKKRFFYTLFFFSVISCSFTLNANKKNDTKCDIKTKENKIKNIALGSLNISKAFLEIALIDIFSTIIHEEGHAISAKVVDPTCDPTIHFCVYKNPNSEEKAEVLFNFKNIYIHKGQLDQHYMDAHLNTNKTGFISIALSGGLSQLSFFYSALFYKAFKQKFNETKNYKQSLIWGIKNSLSGYKNILEKNNLSKSQVISKLLVISYLYKVIMQTILYTLTPSTKGGDGTLFWNTILGKETYHNKNNKLAFLITKIVRCITLYKSYTTYKEYFKNHPEKIQNDFPLIFLLFSVI